MSGRDRRTLRRLVAIGIELVLIPILVVGARATYAAFSATTSNSGNSFGAGSVTLTDNDSGNAMYSVTGMMPGDSSQFCITVSYSGSLTSNVRLYASTSGSLGTYLNMTVTQGGGTPITTNNASFNAACTNFTADTSGSQIYSGTLSNFSSTYTNYSTGLSLTNISGSTTWAQNDFRAYKFVISLNNDNNAQGLSGTATFTWEADNT